MNTPLLNTDYFWHNPTAVRMIALLAVGLLIATVMLLRRRKSSGRAAAVICLLISIGLHAAILIFTPRMSLFFSGGQRVDDSTAERGSEEVSVAVFDPSLTSADTAAADSPDDAQGEQDQDVDSDTRPAAIAPLSLARPIEELPPPVKTASENPSDSPQETASKPAATSLSDMMPTTLAAAKMPSPTDAGSDIDALGDWLNETLASAEPPPPAEPTPKMPADAPAEPVAAKTPAVERPAVAATAVESPTVDPAAEQPPASPAAKGLIPGEIDSDFAARQGAAKSVAIETTGGDASTEAAVAAALRYLTKHQRADGAWDPLSSGAGRERAPLGLQRGAAGKRAETGLTGLALLALLGAGNTHQSGEYPEAVYRGLVYLLGRQRDDGSLAGDASVYAAHYCHAMASLSLAEAAAMTQDPAAIEATRRAIAYSKSTQHPVTGGWRYTRGDRGDLSQLGWQALLIDGARRAGALDGEESMQRGVERFLTTVRSGRAGGLACYRPGERTTPTMTAEALAVRLLIGEKVPPDTVQEAETALLASLPGHQIGPDNYYYWYYASLALHQLQDDAWKSWNQAMKQRLLSTQQKDGSWPDTSLWGGYGGSVYTTAMATLCLETYYRHELRDKSEAQ
ncbi:prenyltransferase/squalene oxidase repeat-containing protein [Allorhodopirellula solitaria]|uniref:Prenyltransferase and squalene oxidase repeat protein n=1 Tax=Allorhodopirellula solitaria TaxID=2527987 RepID=A0A5C5YFY2_9BACT|nr:prenyltransferase/squalene oxidase repeat-containing protein [Allorhodopirellula solitaria]TWT74024.1 hypothetical protein CA85_09080 [Allorhodopirellula solitaria]